MLWDLTPSSNADRAHSDRPVKFWTHLDGLLMSGPPVAAIAFEQVAFHNSHYAAIIHGELCGIIKLIAFQRGIPLTGFAPGTLKKIGGGNGSASKELVRDRVCEVFGVGAPATLDESDALACLLCLLSGADSNGQRKPVPKSKAVVHADNPF